MTPDQISKVEAELKEYTASVEVQFSGNAKTYHYKIGSIHRLHVQALLARDSDPQEMRVVVPTKIKDDRLSLSIANVVGFNPTAHPEAVLPIVELIGPFDLAIAKYAVQKAEAAAANQGA